MPVTARTLLAAAAIMAPAVPAFAQPYPAKPIRLIVAQAPGSATDLVARLVAQKMADTLGQQVIVDNRAGAGGLLGTELVAKAVPDGYTLLVSNISTHGVNPALYRKLPYDAVKDFAPVVLLTVTPNLLAVHPSLPVKTTKEFIAFAKARPGQLNYGTPGNGSSQHLATELFRAQAGISAVHVPYKGSPAAMSALMAGEVSWMIPTLTTALPQIRANRIRPLAVTALQPIEDLPGVPTVAATLPGFDVVSWYGISAPAGTPAAVIARLNTEAAKALALPEVRKILASSGMTTAAGTPEEFGVYTVNEVAKWTKVVRAANIQAE